MSQPKQCWLCMPRVELQGRGREGRSTLLGKLFFFCGKIRTATALISIMFEVKKEDKEELFSWPCHKNFTLGDD